METTVRPATPEIEIGHVLFVGVYGISKLSGEQQATALSALDKALYSSEEFQELFVSRRVIKNPASTGIAIVAGLDFAENLIRVAEEVQQEGTRNGSLQLSLSLHSGPVFRQFDISLKETVAGGGINVAKRINDHAEAGDLLVSAEFVKAIDAAWLEKLQPRDPVQVRAGMLLDVFSFSSQSPQSSVRKTVRTQVVSPAPMPIAGHSPKRKVVLLYKRRCSPDEYLVSMLEVRLTELGHEVFVDRHLAGGVHWGNEIRRKISEADFVIPLLSMSAAQSEMVLDEIIDATESQKRTQKPQIVPLRIAYEGDLPNEIGKYLNHIQYCIWEETADDQRIIAEFQQIFAKEPEIATQIGETPPSELPSMSIEAVGGAVPLGSPFYIERKSDKFFRSAILSRDSTVLAKGARQMGKTSLLARGIHEARQQGWRVAVTDFQKLEPSDLESSENLIRALAESICSGLNAKTSPSDTWKNAFGPNKNLERYLSEVIKEADSHFVWALDEIDRLLVVPYGSEVFGLFRSWHNDRALNPHGPFGRMTQVFAYATEAHLFIRDLNQSPFNIGTHLTLGDFTFQETQRMNELYQSPLNSEQEIETLHELVGGHPFLLRKALFAMTVFSMSLAEFCKVAGDDDGPVADHLKRIVFLLSKDPKLADELKLILQGRKANDEKSFFRLRSAGVVAGSSPDEPRMRCKLYHEFLRRHLFSNRGPKAL